MLTLLATTGTEVVRLLSALTAANSWLPLTASVEAALTAASATPVTCRLTRPPDTPSTALPVTLLTMVVEPIFRPAQPALGAPAVEDAPSATSLATVAEAPWPSATALAKPAEAPLPMATALAPAEVASGPMAVESAPPAVASASVEVVRKYLTPPPVIDVLTAANALATSG